MLIGDHELPVGRDDVDMARLEPDAAGHLRDLHARSSGQDARELALVLGVEVDDDDESGIDIVGQALEKHLQGMDSSCRRSDSDGREALGALLGRFRIWGRPFIVHWEPLLAYTPWLVSLGVS
jgi:hypothetical protein